VTLIYLIAGEQSGDALGARLIHALKAARPGLEFAGIGGSQMAEAGLTSLFPMRELALMGLLEVLPRVAALRRRIAETVADIETKRPAIVVTIDSPGFTHRVLERIKPLGLKRIHYVAPQVWGWRQGRVRRYPGLFQDLLCLLPFEPAFFIRHGIPAEFTGHPVLESGADQGNAARFRAQHGIAATERLITIMPGSRRSETARLLPVFGQALAILRQALPDLRAVVPAAATVAAQVRGATENWEAPPIVVTGNAEKHDAFAASDGAIVKSGTSTLEVALAGVPMVVAYKVNPVTAAIGRRLIKVKYASIINLLADREILPELIQENCTAPRIAQTLLPLLNDSAAARTQREDAAAMLAKLRAPEGQPSEAAAAAVLRLLDKA
jgi:lipid-A-disaccharide synthase